MTVDALCTATGTASKPAGATYGWWIRRVVFLSMVMEPPCSRPDAGSYGDRDQVVALGREDARARELADLQRLRRFFRGEQPHAAIDLGRVGVAAADAALAAERRCAVDQYLHRRADALAQLGGRGRLGDLHEARTPFLPQLRRDGVRQVVGRGAFDRRVGKAAGPIDARFVHELQQVLEFGLGLAGETGDESAADDELRADLAPARDALEVLLAARGPLHAPEHVGVRMLERHVQVRQD